MAKRKIKTDPYSKEAIQKNRTFPVWNTVLIVFLALVQAILILVAVNIDPQPQDVIEEYDITVVPRSNGTLDVTYSIVWRALDSSEELTWVEIGMPNESYTVDYASLSSTIQRAEPYEEEGYTSLRLYLDRPYVGGEKLTFSFTVNQRLMLCENEEGRFYELVPGWFNATPVKNYRFFWQDKEGPVSTNGKPRVDGYLWEGALDCGGYVLMSVQYAPSAFPTATVVHYEPFDDSGTWNELEENRALGIFFCVFMILLLVLVEVYVVDSYVSYHRGRGFMRGYGYHVHVYGRVNPHYTRARARHNATHGGGGGGGRGCACACACACAGGGRAGCSQKDTYASANPKELTE